MARLSPRGHGFTELLLEVFRLNGALLNAGDILTRPVSLTSARWQVLGVVEHGPVPVANVARIMGLSRQAVQQTANGLEREGFIEFLDNPHHRRAKLMSLTEQGREALEYVTEQQAIWANKIGVKHRAEDLRKALEVLQALRESLEQSTQPTPKQ
jgi:DNA-binding MarR family transcriptional regulator